MAPKERQLVKYVRREAARVTDRAVVHSIDGQEVSIRLGGGVLRGVKVQGDAGTLTPGQTVEIYWREGRPVVLAHSEVGTSQAGPIVSEALGAPGELSVSEGAGIVIADGRIGLARDSIVRTENGLPVSEYPFTAEGLAAALADGGRVELQGQGQIAFETATVPAGTLLIGAGVTLAGQLNLAGEIRGLTVLGTLCDLPGETGRAVGCRVVSATHCALALSGGNLELIDCDCSAELSEYHAPSGVITVYGGVARSSSPAGGANG